MSTEQYRDVWAYCVKEEDHLTRPSLEILAAARKVADKIGQQVGAVIIGYNLGGVLDEAIAYGADKVLYADEPWLKNYLCLPYTRVVCGMAEKMKPYAMLFVADELGRDLSPRVAYRLNTGLATDNINLEVEDYYFGPTNTTYKNVLAQIRPDFATRVAKIFTPRHRPQIASIRPGNFEPLPEDRSRVGEKIRFRPQPVPEDFSVEVIEEKQLPKTGVDLEAAKVVVSIGLGVLKDGSGNPRSPREGYELAKRLVDLVKERFGVPAELGATRALIYSEFKELEGLVTSERQVGQTGKTVSPDVYIAVGISGSVQHRVGMIKSKKIVAVNNDPKAPIFDIAHYGVKADLYDVVPKLIEIIEGRFR
ncbi:MAG: electron transfer flavoprotein subunit alpha/FixB family protein [Candidatus Caldarchaeum sp.]|uniref:Electron transfer flavoprotein subunit alpha/FixB family protein n=1 Tax=Caldiarchaeum subterraneum TaxID=311458 RepID=A0A7C5L6G1_CALS0